MPNWPGDDAVFPFYMQIIKQFEGFRAAPYLDSAGVPTIGYGTIRYPDGAKVTMQDAPITEALAESFVKQFMSGATAQIAGWLTRPATLHQAAAMASLTYNIGASAFKGSTVLAKFNAGDIQGAADAFMMWDKARVKGVLTVVQGLVNRRTKEREIFLTPD